MQHLPVEESPRGAAIAIDKGVVSPISNTTQLLIFELLLVLSCHLPTT
jgi:hypothetical protein